jgi:pimeloyl-ACP methyl ester carboxylesterase
MTVTTLPTPKPDAARPRSRLRLWLGRSLGGLLLALVGLIIIGMAYQAIASARDARAWPAPGRLVDVGGYRLHIHCVGQGGPTVVLDHVGATSSAQWALIQPEIAGTTRVCAYDRAGFGWSDRATTPRDAQQKALELHTLLTNAGERGPYVLVGHSHGAFVVRMYAAAYPDDVAGLALVDPGIPYDAAGVPDAINAEWKTADSAIIDAGPVLVRLGVFRLGELLGGLPGTGDLSPHDAAVFNALNATTKIWDTIKAERDTMPATSAQVLAAPLAIGDRPVWVLSAGQPSTASRQAWTKLNADLAAQAPNSHHQIAAEAAHMDFALDKDTAQLTIAAIQAVLEAARSGQPLSD